MKKINGCLGHNFGGEKIETWICQKCMINFTSQLIPLVDDNVEKIVRIFSFYGNEKIGKKEIDREKEKESEEG